MNHRAAEAQRITEANSMNGKNKRRGGVELIFGPMFAGKTTELIRRVETFPRWSRLVFRHPRDTRYGTDQLRSHDSDFLHPAETPINTADILGRAVHAKDVAVVALDEAQFYDKDELPNLVENLLANINGLAIVVAGLSVKYTGKPFAWVKKLRPFASSITELRAVCGVCGNPATMQNLRPTGKVMNGTAADYYPVCRAHHCSPRRALESASSVPLVSSVAKPSPRRSRRPAQ